MEKTMTEAKIAEIVGVVACNESMAAWAVAELAAHLRGGVVTPEAVNRACEAYDDHCEDGGRAEWFGMRAALQTLTDAQPARGVESGMHAVMEGNAWRAAMIGLCQGKMSDVGTPDKAAEHLRKRLAKNTPPAPPVGGVDDAVNVMRKALADGIQGGAAIWREGL